jgi:hypothetical protein
MKKETIKPYFFIHYSRFSVFHFLIPVSLDFGIFYSAIPTLFSTKAISKAISFKAS